MAQAALVVEGTSVVYLEPSRINRETETRGIGRGDNKICCQRDIFLKLDTKNNKYKLDMEFKLVWGTCCCCYRKPKDRLQ